MFTADHGDFLGDHWLGEGTSSGRGARADDRGRNRAAWPAEGARREFVGGAWTWCPRCSTHRSADPGTTGSRPLAAAAAARPGGRAGARFVVGSLDMPAARRTASSGAATGPAWMVRDARHKLIVWEGYADQLFDLQDDPDELRDRGAAALEPVAAALRDGLLHVDAGAQTAAPARPIRRWRRARLPHEAADEHPDRALVNWNVPGARLLFYQRVARHPDTPDPTLPPLPLPGRARAWNSGEQPQRPAHVDGSPQTAGWSAGPGRQLPMRPTVLPCCGFPAGWRRQPQRLAQEGS